MRIYITGVGAVSPLGPSAEETIEAVLAGRRAQGPVTLFDPTGCRSSLAAEIAGLRASDVAPAAEVEAWSRTDAMAVVAAREALAGLGDEPVDLVLGGTTAGMFETEDLLAEMHRDSGARKPLSRMLSHPLSSTGDRMRDAVRDFRRVRTLCSACSSGANALMLAASWLRAGRSERVLAGGADGLCRLTYVGFSSLGALSPEPCRPFDAARDGLNLGEAAAFVLLESERAARARGAEPLAELRGWAVGAEAHHITNPEPSGAAAGRVMEQALKRAGLRPDDVDYVNAHGTATRLNDKMEAAALRRCFGERLASLPVSSTKGHIGHTLGAAGAVEAVITTLAMRRSMIPPTMGLSDVDPECRLDHVPERARPGRIRAAMSDSFGFGGSDAVIVLSEPGAFEPPEPVVRQRVYLTASGTVGALGVLGTEEATAYLGPGAEPPDGPGTFEAKDHLELSRARRIDRAGRLAATAMKLALERAEVSAAHPRAGAVVGSAFGSIDDCSAFIARFYEKGARFASPAIFPNLLPSSAVAHASIYHGLQGAVFSSADLGATAEGAMVTAGELIAADEADLMLAGAVEQHSPLVEEVMGPLCTGALGGVRGEGAVVFLLESERGLAARGGRAPAEIRWARSWRGKPDLSELPAPEGRVIVTAARLDGQLEELLQSTSWSTVERRSATTRAGEHECSGGFAAAAALGAIVSGKIDGALIVGLAPDRGYALLLGAVESP